VPKSLILLECQTYNLDEVSAEENYEDRLARFLGPRWRGGIMGAHPKEVIWMSMCCVNCEK
jgi:hypothetical protein